MTTFVDTFRSDFDLDAELSSGETLRADILWRDNGHYVLWFMGTDLSGNPSPSLLDLFSVSPDWHFKAAAVFDVAAPMNGDILWQNDNGSLALWQWTVNATTTGLQISLAFSALPNPGPTWHLVGDNDFNQDGGDDILWRNDNGSLAIWTGINAATGTVAGIFAGTQNPGPTWHVVATGDAGNDQKADILWQNDNGAMALWEGATFAAGTFTFNLIGNALPIVDLSWHVKGMADLAGDGNEDIVFQNDNGVVVVWDFLPGFFGELYDPKLVNLNPGPSWHIVGLRDMNGDHRADILWQNDNGAAAVWEDYQSLGGGTATFNTVVAITPNPNPNGHVWDLL